MCNLYRMEKAIDAVASLARELGQQVLFPEGLPNVQPRDVRISERAPILRAGEDAAQLVERRWSWPGPTGKPVFNFRSDGRRFAPQGRCVVLADAFYEFTAPADPKARTKQRWRFTWPGHEWFGIAGIWRSDPQVGEAFTMLTAPPGPDVAPYHNRQIVLLSPADCFRWLTAVNATDLLRPLPEGSLNVEAA
ncbi:MAG: SOS response-associated peptidase family protein [Tsuneonella sp.]